MPTDLSRLLKELSRSDLENLLAAKDEVEELEHRRDALQKELADVERRLDRLAGMATGRGAKTTRKKRATKRSAKKRTAKKTAKKSAKKTATKRAAKKTARKTSKKAKTARAAGAAKPGRRSAKTAGARQPTLEDVVVQVLRERGDAMPFKEILDTITSRKLFASRSKSFDNVLRRTISTSDRIKRVGRGVYTV